ncbi:MFS transporter [Gordonia bronchialis]|uniref:MFS transporter n=1 Tax=Gordonia bronchialis TaxID=2054 RepID=UPI00242C5EB7|nr:MFS transporter [Gordonia bronchialis]
MGSIFGVRDYRHLFGAQLVALFGTGLATVALGLLAYELADSDAAAVLGTALALKMVAYVLIAPIAGAFADRLPRRGALVGLDAVRAAVVLALPFVDHVWQVYVLVVVLQSASAAFTPTFQAALPDVLPDEQQYTRALSYSQLASTMETLLSPLLAAVLVSVVSFHWLFVATAGGFVVSAVLVGSSRVPDAPDVQRGGIFDRALAGVVIFRATPRLRGLLGMNLVVAAVGSIVMVNTVNYVQETLGRAASSVAVLLACNGIGVIAAAVVVPGLLRRRPERDVMLAGCGILIGATGAALALSLAGDGGWRWPAVGMIWAVIGVGSGVVLTPVGRVLRRSSSAADRPAVFAAQFSLSHGCWLVAYPLAGWGATEWGYTPTWTVLGLLAATGVVTASRAWPAHDPEVLVHDHDAPVEADHLVHAVPADGGRWRHEHVFVIDDRHHRWPDVASAHVHR